MRFSPIVFMSMLAISPIVLAGPRKTRGPIDPDDAYKNNCLRCHASLPQYSARMNKTIMMHMQQAANLPRDEAQAILRYLDGTPLDAVKTNQPSSNPQPVWRQLFFPLNDN